MAVFIGGALLRRLVAEKAQVSPEEVDKVLDAYQTIVLSLAENGAKVRVFDGMGYFMVVNRKPTRKSDPRTKALIETPAKRRLTFKLSRRGLHWK